MSGVEMSIVEEDDDEEDSDLVGWFFDYGFMPCLMVCCAMMLGAVASACAWVIHAFWKAILA